MKKWFFLIVMTFLCLIVVTPVNAQETSQVRFAHFVFDAAPVNIFVDEAVFTGEDDSAYALNPLELSRGYVELSAGTPHTFAVVPVENTLDEALFEPVEFTLEAGNHYTLAIMGNVVANDLHFALMDETAAIKSKDPTVSAVDFVFNNLYGLPAVDFYWAEKLMIENLAYGDYVLVQDPTEGKGSYLTPHGDPTTKLFDYTEAIGGPPQTISYFGFAGHYPGVLWEDYGTPYLGNFIGQPVTVDGGSIKVGDVVKVDLNEAGFRYTYELVVETDTKLDIMLKADQADLATDALLHIYDSNGSLLVVNDELEGGVNHDAGVIGFELPKGTYVIEAASYFDTFLGDYTLSVTATE